MERGGREPRPLERVPDVELQRRVVRQGRRVCRRRLLRRSYQRISLRRRQLSHSHPRSNPFLLPLKSPPRTLQRCFLLCPPLVPLTRMRILQPQHRLALTTSITLVLVAHSKTRKLLVKALEVFGQRVVHSLCLLLRQAAKSGSGSAQLENPLLALDGSGGGGRRVGERGVRPARLNGSHHLLLVVVNGVERRERGRKRGRE